MRFGSTAKVLLKCKLKYYRISECVAGRRFRHLRPLCTWPPPLQALRQAGISVRQEAQTSCAATCVRARQLDGQRAHDRTWTMMFTTAGAALAAASAMKWGPRKGPLTQLAGEAAASRAGLCSSWATRHGCQPLTLTAAASARHPLSACLGIACTMPWVRLGVLSSMLSPTFPPSSCASKLAQDWCPT